MIAWLKSYYGRIWKYKDLLLVFIWREFSIRYKQTIIGVMWAVLQPLSMMVLFTFIFSYVIETKVSDYPYAVFFFSGLLPWTLFDTSVKYSVPSLSAHYHLVTKIYFPREIIPFSCIAVAFVDFLMAFVVYFLLLLAFGVGLNLNFLWVFPLTLVLVLFVSAISISLACLNVFYRDVKLAIGFLMQIWFFATPVFYSTEKLDPMLRLFMNLNPMTFFIENFRKCTLGGESVDMLAFLSVTVLVVALFLTSVKVFTRVERMFADVM